MVGRAAPRRARRLLSPSILNAIPAADETAADSPSCLDRFPARVRSPFRPSIGPSAEKKSLLEVKRGEVEQQTPEGRPQFI